MNPTFTLTPWQKKQAALLYHFASMDYLKGLQTMVNNLINGTVDPTLDKAKSQGRDAFLADAGWGASDTSENWGNNAWPFLKDLQLSVAKDVALRATETYKFTAVNQCFRGLQEYSMAWSTPEEEDRFIAAQEAISKYSGPIDCTFDNYDVTSNYWNDPIFAVVWAEEKAKFPLIPKFQVRTDVVGTTGKKPIRTGVYVPMDDPHGSLTFGWTGDGGCLSNSNTFNALGIELTILTSTRPVWHDEEKLYQLAMTPKYKSVFLDEFLGTRLPPAAYAPDVFKNQAITQRPCQWYFVEMVNGEFENVAELDAAVQNSPAVFTARVEGGKPCPQTGWYFTPVQTNSRRYFSQGAAMPSLSGDYGVTIWQWDANQSTPRL